MAYIGNQPATGENNSFKILDDISSYTLTFDGSSASVVSVANDTITQNNHRFITGQSVTYSTTGTAIGGLTSDTVYYIIKSDQNTIKLAASLADANNNIAIDLTGLGVGSTHTIIVAFDGINTKFKATYDDGTKAAITRAAQLTISINGVIQQPNDTATPTNGFGFDLDSVIVFSVAPTNTDTFWGYLVANNFPTFDISDNAIDSFAGDGSSVDFTLSKTPANNQNVLVTLDGVVQYPSDATTTRSYSVSSNILTFVSAPGNGVDIQVRHIGFAGATSSSVTGFYGRTGNAVLTNADNINVGNINSSGIGTFSSGIVVATGSTSAPSISPSGDSNTGIFFPSADTVCIGEGGSEVIRVNSNGAIGINTTLDGTRGGFPAPQLFLKSTSTSWAGGIHVEASADESVGTINHTSNGFEIGQSYRSSGSYKPIIFKTAAVTRVTVDTSGRVTMPYQPMFYALGGNGTSTGYIVFSTAEPNVGSHYSTVNGRFTAPVAGYYLFNFSVFGNTGASSSSHFWLRMYRNGSHIGGTYHSQYNDTRSYETVSGSSIHYMNANDYMNVYFTGFSASEYGSDYSHFSGFLIG